MKEAECDEGARPAPRQVGGATSARPGSRSRPSTRPRAAGRERPCSAISWRRTSTARSPIEVAGRPGKARLARGRRRQEAALPLRDHDGRVGGHPTPGKCPTPGTSPGTTAPGKCPTPGSARARRFAWRGPSPGPGRGRSAGSTRASPGRAEASGDQAGGLRDERHQDPGRRAGPATRTGMVPDGRLGWTSSGGPRGPPHANLRERTSYRQVVDLVDLRAGVAKTFGADVAEEAQDPARDHRGGRARGPPGPPCEIKDLASNDFGRWTLPGGGSPMRGSNDEGPPSPGPRVDFRPWTPGRGPVFDAPSPSTARRRGSTRSGRG